MHVSSENFLPTESDVTVVTFEHFGNSHHGDMFGLFEIIPDDSGHFSAYVNGNFPTSSFFDAGLRACEVATEFAFHGIEATECVMF